MQNNPKIFDIIPPDKVRQYSSAKPEGFLAKKNKPEGPGKKSPFRVFLILAIFLILIAGAGLNFFFAKAEIQIWPKSENSVLNEKIIVSPRTDRIDASGKILPGKIFEDETTLSQNFQATGKAAKENKAEGIIKVFNTYSASPQILIATTRFMSAEGKLFKSTERVTVPGTTEEKGRTQPGSVDVKVVADQPGEDYNIAASTFSIPGFVGTPKYTAFYGRSSESMKGGFKGDTPQITQSDLDRAKNSLTEKTLEQAKKDLKNKIPSEYTVLENSLTYEIIETTSSAQAGDLQGSFNYSVKIKVKVMAVKSADLDAFAKELILSGDKAAKKVQEGSLNFSLNNPVSEVEKGTTIFDGSFSAKIYSPVDEEGLKSALAGKSAAEAAGVFENFADIEKYEINPWPFPWVKIPADENGIEIELIL